MEDHEVTAAPCPLTLTIKGKDVEFLAVPFSDRDYDELDLWVQSQVISITRNSLRLEIEEATDDNPVNFIYEEEMQAASKAALGVSIYEPSGTQILNTPKGTARMFWMMTRKNHPAMQYKDCVGYFRTIENLYEVRRIFAQLNPNHSSTKESATAVGNEERVASS